MSSRHMSLLPRAALRRDREQEHSTKSKINLNFFFHLGCSKKFTLSLCASYGAVC
jgi:hypothetical protein